MLENYLPQVRSQYEALPYPPCNPQDDHQRLVQTWLEDLPMINHYCFAGRQSFQNGFRALVAGGGTGDATIFLAEQLRHTDAHIVHLDMSQASIAIAQARAKIRDLLPSLPPFNGFKLSEALHQDHKMGDAGIYDLLLHSQDRSYSVGELFDWLGDDATNGKKGHGMHLAFTDVQRGRSPYLPRMVLGSKPPAMAANLAALPRRRQYEIAELLIGSIITHSLYVTRSAACTAPYGDADYVPLFFHEPLTGEIAAQVFGSQGGQPFVLNHQHSGMAFKVNPGRYGPQILRLIDGEKSFANIFDAFRAAWKGQAAAPDNAALFADFADCYEALNALDRLLLRHPVARAKLKD